MANEAKLAILRQGAKAWNKWREENVDAIVDLGGSDLSGANFSRVNLRKCLKTSRNGTGRANLQDDQIQTSLPDRPE